MQYQSTEQYSDILDLRIADGLKELLIDYGFSRQKILRIQASQLASILGIEEYSWQDYLQCAKRKS